MEYLSPLDKVYISQDVTYQNKGTNKDYIPKGCYLVVNLMKSGDAIIIPLDYDSYHKSCTKHFGESIVPSRISINSDLLSQLVKLDDIHEL
jgi:hypothetical protein